MQRVLSRAATDTGMLDLFDDHAVQEHKTRIYDTLLHHVLKAPRSSLGLPAATTEAEDDAQRQAIDEVTGLLRRNAS